MQTVPLNGRTAAGRVALVDDEDYDLVARHRWCGWTNYRRSSDLIYAMTHIVRDGKETTIRMHQLITGWPQTDHIDHDGLNNQRSNLRPATAWENARNSRPPQIHTSRFKGVSWLARTRKWKATIRPYGAAIALGCYEDEVDAARAYDAAAREAYGEYAYLNFPDSHERPERPVRSRRFPELPNETIVALRDSGLTFRQIAAEVGMTYNAVRLRWLAAAKEERTGKPDAA